MSCTVCGCGGDNVGDEDVLEDSVDVGASVGDNEDELERGEEVDSPKLLVVSKNFKP